MTCHRTSLGVALSNAGYLPVIEADPMIAAGSLLLFEPGHLGVPSGNPAIPEVPYNKGSNLSGVQFPNIASRTAGLLVNQTMFDATVSIANLTATITAVSGGLVNIGDEIWNAAGTVMLAVVTGHGTSNGGTGTVSIWPLQALASTAVKIRPGLKPLLRRNGQRNSSEVEVNFKTEYTPRGGVHIASSRSTMVNFAYMGLSLPGAIKKFIYDNPTHDYYLSTWQKVTASELAGHAGAVQFVGLNSGASSYLFQQSASAVSTASRYTLAVGARDGSTGFLNTGMAVEQVANTYRGAALTGYTSTMHDFLWAIGSPVGAFGPSYGVNKSKSAVLYRVYLEDLTVSGRSFDEAKKVDDGLYALKCGAGNRYSSDTNTAPSSLIA